MDIFRLPLQKLFPLCSVPTEAVCVDGVTETSKIPYSGGTIIVTTVLQMSKLSWERLSNLLKTTQQFVMGLQFGLRKVGSKAVLPPTKLSCLLVSQQPARDLCGGKSWTRHEETWTQNLALHLCLAWPWISHFPLWACFLICLPCKVVWGWNKMVSEK